MFLLLAAPILSARAASSAAFSPSSLDRLVKMDLWGARLSDFVREAGLQTGVEILLYPPDFPPASGDSDLYLVSGSVPLRTVLECLARRFSFRYRVSYTGRIEISKGYDWAAANPALRFQRLDAIVPRGGADVGELSRRLREFIKPLSMLNGDYNMVLEKSPRPDNPDSLRVVMALPSVLSEYLERGVLCLSGDPGDYPPPAAGGQRLFAIARRDLSSWEELLGRRVSMPRARDLRAILREICDQAGVAVALAGAPVDVGGLTGVAGESVGFGRITEELGKRYNLGKRVFLACGALVFERGSAGEWEMDRRNRELYWGGLAIAGFDAGNLAARFGGGDNLVAAARSRIFPELWRDPSCSLVYSDVSGRLAVVAPANAVEALAAWLNNSAPEN